MELAAHLEEREIYAAVFERAARYASRHVSPGEAHEVAHDVAVAVLHWTLAQSGTIDRGRSLNGFIHRAVINRLRDGHRSATARARAEDVHVTDVQHARPAWANPVDALEAEELTAIMRAVIAAMPKGMRTIFLLVREHDRSYREVADELAIGVGTVHTQLSRAHALLRAAIEQYRHQGAPSVTALVRASL